ncbi:MAG: hypothetical protein ACLTZH_06970 [Subdoligranulum sp.]
MFKKLMSAVAAAALCVSLAACGATATSEAAAEATATLDPAVTEAPAEETASAETADGALRVAGLKGPTTMGLVNLMAGEDAADYDFEMYGKADEIVPQLVKVSWTQPLCPLTWPQPCTRKPTAPLRLPASTPWACCTLWKTARL